MAIWFELIVMLLVTYALGLGIGWVLWGRGSFPLPEIEDENDKED